MELDRELERQLQLSGYDAEAFAERYEAFRPRAPAVLTDLLPALADVARPRLVVDIGSGTGLSTRLWADVAEDVVGVEPSEAMRRVATAINHAPNVSYSCGSSYASGVPDGAADIVTCSQSLQWMQPEPTFAEVARILRSGGVFAAYQYERLQTPFWEPEAAFEEVRRRVSDVNRELNVPADRPRWPVTLERVEDSGRFRKCRELHLHSVEEGDAERLIGFALSEGSTATLLARGYTESDLGLEQLRRVAARWLGGPAPWWLSYRVIVARK
jgi:SAM-dependent methyltransferase